MRRSVNSLIDYTVRATDGDLGTVEDFYFDDETWTIRYMVVDTGGWLSGRFVLISPIAMEKPDWESHTFPVTLTRDQVCKSPDIDTNKPVSRQHEAELHAHYQWPIYWGAVGGTNVKSIGDPHLRSTWHVTGYDIHARDGDIGHVKDFILDDVKWGIRFLVVDTGTWLPGRKVLVAPQWTQKVSWEDSKIFVDLTRESVRNSPDFDPSKPINMDYEGKLYDWYGRPSDRSGA